MGGTVADVNAAMLAIDVAICSTIKAVQDKFQGFQADAQKLLQ